MITSPVVIDQANTALSSREPAARGLDRWPWRRVGVSGVLLVLAGLAAWTLSLIVVLRMGVVFRDFGVATTWLEAQIINVAAWPERRAVLVLGVALALVAAAGVMTLGRGLRSLRLINAGCVLGLLVLLSAVVPPAVMLPTLIRAWSFASGQIQ
jgi:hypothetical protein